MGVEGECNEFERQIRTEEQEKARLQGQIDELSKTMAEENGALKAIKKEVTDLESMLTYGKAYKDESAYAGSSAKKKAVAKKKKSAKPPARQTAKKKAKVKPSKAKKPAK